MNPTLAHWARAIGTSSLHDHVVHWLRTVPGLPPIVQTVHILSIGCVVASAVMIQLRVLGVAARNQAPDEMIRRLMPWMWISLVLLFLSGATFVITRPARYFSNPIFAIKFALLIPAVLLSALVARLQGKTPSATPLLRSIAALSFLLWVGVILAGRWIAYADYIFPPPE